MSGLRIVINSRKNFSESDAKRHDDACVLCEIVLNSVEFRTEVFSYKYTSTEMTSIEVYQTIMTGAERLSPTPDGEVDVAVELYYRNNRVIGYTSESDEETHLNNKFFSKYDASEIAGNLVHEWLHKVGFDHASAKDVNSVPYRVGYIVRDLVKKGMQGMMFTPIALYDDVNVPLPIKQKQYVCKRNWRTFWLTKVCWYA